MNTSKLKELTNEKGRIDLDIVPNMLTDNGIAATAWYTDGWYNLPGNNICLMKKMLSFMGQYGRTDTKFQPEEYNAMICPALAEIFNIPSAIYFMAEREGQEYMLTPNFLEEGEELIHIARVEEAVTGQKQKTTAIQGSTKKISDMYNYLEKYLRNYEYKGKKLEEKEVREILFEYLKQKFFSRFIQNTDEHVFNTAIVIKGLNVKMSNMYDYDFTLAKRTTDVVPNCEWKGIENEMILDNGKSDVESFIEQYANYPAMKEFISNFLNIFSFERLETIVTKNIGVVIDREETKEHYRIIGENVRKTREAYDKVYSIEKEGEER